ncbi:proteoglycan 4-like [Macrosteles quadrilineatus]|uniref:proteoglycan 4-like n=1 Tax=Macrosteles quadrilineatus TaxID=74068 RepID=UPI0023E19417|nr:proteoglycan 4-like [Macrosteles quadrilineatus]
MDDIQSWWEVPSIAHFCSLFRVAFNLLDFDIEELEEALLTDGAEDTGSSLLQELIVRLLCGCLGNNGISTFNYQMFLRRLFRQKCREYGKENPFNSDIDFQFLPLRTKVEILHALCDFRLDADDVMDVLKNLDSDSLRVHPLGYDENRSAYWYFYGTRLYREDYPHRAKKKKKKAREKKHGRKSRSESESEPDMGCGEWQVVCYTESDWERLAYKMEDSQCREERALHSVLAEDFLPEIPRLFEEKERLQKKRLMEMQPRRQSSRIEKLKHQKEEEKRAQESSADKIDPKENEIKERERRDRDARRAREHRAMLRSRSHTNSECSSSSQTDNASKPRGRQTNNSLASATGQIIIQPSRQKLRTSQVFRQSVEDLQTGLYKILDRLKNHEDAWPFLDPVEEEYAPRYYSVIAKPMDLQRMEDKLDAGEYSTFGEFKADFQLIVDNCRQYNGSENEYTEMVGKLLEAFDAAVDRYLETEISTDEEVAVEFPGEQKGRRRKSSQASKHSPPPSHRSEESDNELPEEVPVKEESEVEAEEEEEEASQKDSESQSSRSQSRSKATKKTQETKRPGKKPTGIKNVTDIEALELATEQTLKDINKWLDDTPRFSEFSSASNSPSQLPMVDDCDGVGSRIEHDYRARLKIRAKEKLDFTRRRFFKDHGSLKRRREVQRTIDRLQPGKSKGNLLSNPSASKNEETSISGNQTGMKVKDQNVETLEKEEQITPKLSLGTVLNSDVIGFGKHSFENSDTEVMKKDEDSQDDSGDEKPLVLEEDDKNSPEAEENLPEDGLSTKKLKEDASPTSNSFEKKTAPVPTSTKAEKSSTPNLSAWFKAFGLPKSQPPTKKKSDINDESKEKLDQFKATPKDTEEVISVDDDKDKKITVAPPLVSPARRQRKASTGSSVSERSSFSQDPTDPMIDGSSPRPSLDEHYLSPQADPNKTPYHHSPLNGTIRVGFYQDTSFPRGSSDKSSSPREPPTPNCSPREPPSCSPRDIPSCSPRTPMASPKSDYPLYSGSSLPYQSPSVNTYDAPMSPYPAHMSYYDTNKPLTDQYRSTPIATEKSVSSTYPVKKRIINEVEQSARSSPEISYRGGSFTPTRNAIENDRSFTPTPGRIPTQPNTRPAYASETALALGLHGISPHLMDPYAEERLLSASYYSNDGLYGKNPPSTTSIHPMYPTSSSVMSNVSYPRDDRGYSRIPPNFSETRPIKVSDSQSSYSNSLPVSKTSTPVINYSGRSTDLSCNAPRSSSPLNYSSHPTAAKTNTPPNLSYVSRSQDSNKLTESPLDFAKVSQNEPIKNKESSHITYPTSRESLPPKVSSPYSRAVSDLSAPGLSYNHSPDLVSGKLSVPPSPLSYPSQQDLLAGKVNYSHPMSDLARFGYPHSVSYNHPMSDLIQAKATSGTYPGRPVDLMTAGYNRPLEVAYQQVSRASTTPKPSEPAAKPAVKKPSKKRKSSDTSTPSGIPAGFQQYLGQSSSEAISLKTSSVVPGSAFNFGPAPLKDSYTSYLEEMRSSNFFAPHPDMSANTKSSSPSPHPPASPFPYLSHAPSRPLSYPHPFMNYPQMLQKEELLRPMVLHQGLLPPTGYPPPGGYLGMHDPMNRSSWL